MTQRLFIQSSRQCDKQGTPFAHRNPRASRAFVLPLRWQTRSVAKEHEDQDSLLASIQSAMDSLLGTTGGSGKNDAARAVRLEALKADVSKFGKDVLENLEHEELHFVCPVVRKVSATAFGTATQCQEGGNGDAFAGLMLDGHGALPPPEVARNLNLANIICSRRAHMPF